MAFDVFSDGGHFFGTIQADSILAAERIALRRYGLWWRGHLLIVNRSRSNPEPSECRS